MSSTSTYTAVVGSTTNLQEFSIPSFLTYGDVFTPTFVSTDGVTTVSFSTNDTSVFSINNSIITVIGISQTATLTCTQGLDSIESSALTTVKKSLSIAVTNQSISYGASLPSGIITYSGFITGDNSSNSLSGSSQLSITDSLSNSVADVTTALPDSYTITISIGTLTSNNYDLSISGSSSTLTITKLNSSVTFPNMSSGIIYGISLANFINSTTSSVNGTIVFKLDDTNGQIVSSSTVLTVGTYTIYAELTPSDISIYNSSSNTITFSVNKATPTVTFPDMSAGIIYGASLTSFINSTLSSVDGTFVFKLNDTNGQVVSPSTILNIGTYTIYAEFTPTDGTLYNNCSNTITFSVNKITPTISYSISNAITYGDTLVNILNATISGGLSGTMSYRLNNVSNTVVTGSTVLLPGTYGIIARFVPSDQSIYNTVETSAQSLTVNKAIIKVGFLGTLSMFVGTTFAFNTTFTFNGVQNPTTLIGLDTIANSITGTADYHFMMPNDTVTQVPHNTISSLPSGVYYVKALIGTLASDKYTFDNSYINSLYINKYTPTVTYVIDSSLPRSFTYGATLSSDYFTATYGAAQDGVTPAGTIKYYTNDGIELTTSTILYGTTTRIYAQYVPDSTVAATYGISNSLNITLNVTPLPVVISYSIPENYRTLAYGYGLTANQLCATASYNGQVITDGNINYRWSLSNNTDAYIGSVFGAGTVTLYAFFSHPHKNYAATNTTDATNSTITISKASLTGTPTNKTINYGSTVTFGTTWTGFVNGNNAANSITGTGVYTVRDSDNNIITNISTANVGTYYISAELGTFASSNYDLTMLSNTATLTINKVTPTLAISSTIYTYGDTSYLTNLSASFNSSVVDGTFVVKQTDNNGTILTGLNPINAIVSTVIFVTFTPSSTNYNSNTASFTIKINKATPTISYTLANSSYTYPTQFGASNMNASASNYGINVPGTFTYSTGSTTLLASSILNVGTYTITVSLVPLDTTNYNNALTTSTLTVNKSLLNVSVSNSYISMTYKRAPPAISAFNIYYSGFLNGDTESSVFGSNKPDYEISATTDFATIISKTDISNSNVGTYYCRLKQGTLPNGNYLYSFVNEYIQFRIETAAPTVTINIGSNPTTFDYGTKMTAGYFNATATILNSSNVAINVPGTFRFDAWLTINNTSVTVSGIQNNNPGYIYPAGSQQMTVYFVPNDTTNIISVYATPITFTVNKITPTITYSIPSNLKTINYGTKLLASQLAATVTYGGQTVTAGNIKYLKNSSTGSTQYYENSYPTVDTTRIYAVFYDNAGNYNTVNASDTITVNKIHASLSWKYPIIQNIPYGLPLSNYQLNAISNTDPYNVAPGTIVYTLTSNNSIITLGTVLNAGTYDFKATMNVTNSNYISETFMITNTITVLKNTPSLTWANPRDITHGTSLDGTQLNATTNVSSASLTYTPASGTAMNTVGKSDLSVTSNYDNSNYLYNSLSTTVNINII